MCNSFDSQAEDKDRRQKQKTKTEDKNRRQRQKTKTEDKDRRQRQKINESSDVFVLFNVFIVFIICISNSFG